MKLRFSTFSRVSASILLLGGLYFHFRELKVEITDPAIQVDHEQIYFKNDLFSGTIIERNLNHNLLVSSHYKDGKKEGYSYQYHHNGAVVQKNLFHLGKKNGRQEAWYIDGKLRSLSYFKNGLADGTLTEWHPNGKVYRFQKIQNGIELENKIFYESGVIYSNYVTKNNRSYGIKGEPLCLATKQEGFK